MTKEEIIKLAREAEVLSEYDSPTGFCTEAALKFAALVAKAERERIADQIDRMPFGDTAASFSIWIREHA